MKALSVKQPFAGWIAEGKKSSEIRSRRYPYLNGLGGEPILICASLSTASNEMTPAFTPATTTSYFRSGIALCVLKFWKCIPIKEANIISISNEAILDAAHLREICEKKQQYAWGVDVDSIQKVKPFSVKGKLGFFDVPDELIEVIK